MLAARLALLLLAWLAPGAPAEPPPADVLAINVLLEPDQPMLDLAAAANARLLVSDPSGFALDADHATHLTVLQGFVGRDDLTRVFAAVAGVTARTPPTGLELTATGYYGLPWQGRSLAGIRVRPTPGLLDFQQQLIAALGPLLVKDGTAAAFVPLPDGRPVGPEIVSYVRDFIPKSSGAKFNPHVTIGIANEADVARLVAELFTPLRFRATSVSVYQLGEYGAARRKLWTSSPGGPRR